MSLKSVWEAAEKAQDQRVPLFISLLQRMARVNTPEFDDKVSCLCYYLCDYNNK